MQEYVAAPFVCGDKSKAPFREPSINDSIMETTGRGLVRIMLIAVLVGGGTLAGGRLSGLWSGTTGDALPYPLPVLTGPGNGLVMAAARLGASERSSIGGNGREVGAAAGKTV